MNNKCRRIFRWMNPQVISMALAARGLINMDDEKFIKIQFKDRLGYDINLDDPKTFDEKLNWLKLYNRNPEYTKLVDKYLVKEYIKKIIGEEYVIPTIGIYNSFDEIDFDVLPTKFVIKCTHDSGGVVIVKDKANMNYDYARKKIMKSMKKNYYLSCREWPYKNIERKIIIEPYLEDVKTNELRDYKFYCFNGFMKALLVSKNRYSKSEELSFDYYDKNFKHLELRNEWHPNAKTEPDKPVNFNKMCEFAEKLSIGFPHVRVDFYEANGRVYFGEMTFFAQGGYLIIHPSSWAEEWGDLIDLSLID